jgi:hypothetical protein
MATFIPSVFPCLRVSEKTRARRGPGEIPAMNPRSSPENRNSNSSSILTRFQALHNKLSQKRLSLLTDFYVG